MTGYKMSTLNIFRKLTDVQEQEEVSWLVQNEDDEFLISPSLRTAIVCIWQCGLLDYFSLSLCYHRWKFQKSQNKDTLKVFTI